MNQKFLEQLSNISSVIHLPIHEPLWWSIVSECPSISAVIYSNIPRWQHSVRKHSYIEKALYHTVFFHIQLSHGYTWKYQSSIWSRMEQFAMIDTAISVWWLVPMDRPMGERNSAFLSVNPSFFKALRTLNTFVSDISSQCMDSDALGKPVPLNGQVRSMSLSNQTNKGPVEPWTDSAGPAMQKRRRFGESGNLFSQSWRGSTQ